MNRAGIHASAFVWRDRGMLVRGPSGSGKSGTVWHALHVLPGHTALVADDRVSIRRTGNGIVARGFEPLSGRIEVAGFGIVTVPRLVETRVDLVVELEDAPERMPERRLDPDLGLPVLSAPRRDAVRACGLIRAWFAHR